MEDFNRIFSLYYNSVFATINKFNLPQHIVEDCTMEVFRKFYKQSQKGQIKNNKAYLRRMATNEALYYLKNNKLKQTVEFQDWFLDRLIQEPSPEESYINKELILKIRELIKHVLDSLHPNQREIGYMYYLESLSIPQIQEILGLSENAVKLRIFRMQKKVIPLLKEKYFKYFGK